MARTLDPQLRGLGLESSSRFKAWEILIKQYVAPALLAVYGAALFNFSILWYIMENKYDFM